MDSTPSDTPRKSLSDGDRERANGELLQAPVEQRNDASPPRLPRLSKRPEPRPLLDQPKLSPSAYDPATLPAFCVEAAAQ